MTFYVDPGFRPNLDNEYPDHELPAPTTGVGIGRGADFGIEHLQHPGLPASMLCDRHDAELDVRCRRYPNHQMPHAGTEDGVIYQWS